MNALEYAIGGTEVMRLDVVRLARHLRSLDERLELHLQCLRAVAEVREAQRLGVRCSRSEKLEALAAMLAADALEGDPQWACDEMTLRPRVPVGNESEKQLREMFQYHDAAIQRHLMEREGVSSELQVLGSQINITVYRQLQSLQS